MVGSTLCDRRVIDKLDMQNFAHRFGDGGNFQTDDHGDGECGPDQGYSDSSRPDGTSRRRGHRAVRARKSEIATMNASGFSSCGLWPACRIGGMIFACRILPARKLFRALTSS